MSIEGQCEETRHKQQAGGASKAPALLWLQLVRIYSLSSGYAQALYGICACCVHKVQTAVGHSRLQPLTGSDHAESAGGGRSSGHARYISEWSCTRAVLRRTGHSSRLRELDVHVSRSIQCRQDADLVLTIAVCDATTGRYSLPPTRQQNKC